MDGFEDPNSWIVRGNCKDADPEIFFPSSRGEEQVQLEAAAKAICELCGVKTECLDFALMNDESGVWGGTNAYERGLIRRAQKRDHSLRTHPSNQDSDPQI